MPLGRLFCDGANVQNKPLRVENKRSINVVASLEVPLRLTYKVNLQEPKDERSVNVFGYLEHKRTIWTERRSLLRQVQSKKKGLFFKVNQVLNDASRLRREDNA